jgi:type I restriction enzyme, S subunit
MANARTAGANLPRLSPVDLASFPISYPESSAEQRRLADILNEADALRRKRAEAINLANDLVPSVFYEMFGDPVSNSNKWRVRSLCELAVVTTGNTPSTANPAYYGDEIEWIKSDNLETPLHIASRAKVHLSRQGQQVARVVGPGSTLVTCIAGSMGTIGNSSMIDRSVAFNQQINALTPKGDVDSFYLYTLVRMIRRAIQGLATSALKNIVNKGNLEGLLVIDPPAILQHEFGVQFREILEVLRHQHESVRAISDLFHSLLQRAFRGEL